MVDWSKVKKKYIPSGDVPSGHTAQSQWDDVFAEIPKGQALVLHEPEVNAGTIWAALKRMQKRGKFKNLRITTKGVHGTAIIYITNTEEPTTVNLRLPKTS